MKQRPILFSGPMVRAILEGRKTQTRRVGKIQMEVSGLGVEYIGHATKGRVAQATYDAFPGRGTVRWAICECPYGVPGERLWVRESWAPRKGWGELRAPINMRFAATHDRSEVERWRPSIHMPRWASRLTLEIVSVRVERVQEISEADAKAEGPLYAIDQEQTLLSPHLTEERNTGCYACAGEPNGIAELCHDALRGKGRPFACWFAALWDSINAARGFGWEKNPWVWVIEFKRVEGAPS